MTAPAARRPAPALHAPSAASCGEGAAGPLAVRVLTLFAFLACFAPIAAGQARAASSPALEFTEGRPFQGAVRRDMARQAAQAAAETMAFGRAVFLLAEHPALLFISAGDAGSFSPPLAGLARMVYSTRVTALGMRGFPPNVQAVVQVALEPSPDLDRAVKKALTRPDLLDLYERAAILQAELVMRYDAAAQKGLSMNPERGGTVEKRLKLTGILNRLTALEGYMALLPRLEKSWNDPLAAHAKLARLVELAPDNPLIRTAMAEVLLQLDRPAEAMEHAGEALALDPGFARAHDAKGTIFLRQRLPALAADSFSRAIAEAPSNPDYRAHRAAAYMVREETALMCADFAKACALGNCEGYAWAAEKGLCAPDAAPGPDQSARDQDQSACGAAP